jgi:transposase
MNSVAQMIEETRDVLELKRVLSVKLGEGGMVTVTIGEVLRVTLRSVRKWRRYERDGVEALRVRYRGSEGNLRVKHRQEIGDFCTTPRVCTASHILENRE